MNHWTRKLFHPFSHETDSGNAAAVDQELLTALRRELKELETLYLAGGIRCSRTCPELTGPEPRKFPDLMLDLHRGLLVKVFIELAHCDRQWNPAEREVALVLLHHVWGPNLDQENLAQVLRNVADQAHALKWHDLLAPFVQIPILSTEVGALNSHVMRIANLIVKADGVVLPGEAAGLKSVQAALEEALDRRHTAAQPAPAAVGPVGQEVGQLVQTQLAGELGGSVQLRLPTAADRLSIDEYFAAPEDAARDGPGNVASERKAARADRTPRAETLAEALRELDQLIGMQSIKSDIHQLVNFLKVQEERARHGLPRTQVSLHTIFRGNPGTGKTTVARILARIFTGLGILEKGHTVETDRPGLVGEYLGQTGPKMNKRLDEALHGILFIDEAYSLIAEQGPDPYGTEAIQVLLKRMEDDRDRLVVVLAGYPRLMERMLRSNPGLSSRFQRSFDFPDYSASELVEIFQSMCRKNQYVVLEATREKLHSGFQSLIDRRDERFGNGRLVRNIFEQAIRRMANRVIAFAPLTWELLTQLLPED